MRDAEGIASHIEVESSSERYTLRAAVELNGLSVPSPRDPLGVPWRLGLSAMLEDTQARKSYWALKHPPGKPDFHHADCFALELD
jgi:hypothetical protein